MKYARSLNFRTELIHSTEGHVIAQITGKGVGQAFRHENGKHCVQRIPETETRGKKQTSIVSVGVLPIKQEAGFEPLRDQDLDITFQTGKQGAGGQHANKTASAVRMKHKPTGLSVFINGRDQHANKREAKKILTARVNELMRSRQDANYDDLRKSALGNGSRSDKIRTYNLMESRVVDHRLGTKTGNVKAIMNGKFNLLFPEPEVE